MSFIVDLFHVNTMIMPKNEFYVLFPATRLTLNNPYLPILFFRVMWQETYIFYLLGRREMAVWPQHRHSHCQSAGTQVTGDLRIQLLVIHTQISSELLIPYKIKFDQYKADNILQKCLIFQNY